VNRDVRALLDLPGRDGALAGLLRRLDAPDGWLALAGLSGPAAALLLPALLDRAPGGKIVLLVPGERES
jgi:hypothetical protein